MDEDLIEQYRYFLKDSIRKEIDFSATDQNKGVGAPLIEKPYPADAVRIDLVKPETWKSITGVNLVAAIGNRQSRRTCQKTPFTLEELSFLLWATQGVREEVVGGHAYRTVPSAGCRHAFETYFHVKGLNAGIYRYLPLSHQLLFEFSEDRLAEKMINAVFRQPYPENAAVTFIWTTIPYRMEWRYGLAAHKVIAIDVGHVCQNLFLPVRRLAPAPAPLPLTTRRHWIDFSALMERMNLPFTCPRLARYSQRTRLCSVIVSGGFGGNTAILASVSALSIMSLKALSEIFFPTTDSSLDATTLPVVSDTATATSWLSTGFLTKVRCLFNTLRTGFFPVSSRIIFSRHLRMSPSELKSVARAFLILTKVCRWILFNSGIACNSAIQRLRSWQDSWAYPRHSRA